MRTVDVVGRTVDEDSWPTGHGDPSTAPHLPFFNLSTMPDLVPIQMIGVTKAETEAMRKQMRSEGGPPGSGPGGGGPGGPGGGFGGPGGGPAGGPPGGAPSLRPGEILWVDVELLDTKPSSSSQFFPNVDEYWGRGLSSDRIIDPPWRQNS